MSKWPGTYNRYPFLLPEEYRVSIENIFFFFIQLCVLDSVGSKYCSDCTVLYHFHTFSIFNFLQFVLIDKFMIYNGVCVRAIYRFF
jgi:hypothetical protein